MDKKIEFAVRNYQCCGCVSGPSLKCFQKNDIGEGCGKHCPGTNITTPQGLISIILGLPNGFCRLGNAQNKVKTKLIIFKDIEQQQKQWGYNKFNVPVWRHELDNGIVVIRGFIPRTNEGFLHLILDADINCFDGVEITQNDIDNMD